MKIFGVLIITGLLLSFMACGNGEKTTPGGQENVDIMNDIAKTYVKLCFHVGKTDKDYVDAYFGPNELKEQATAETKTLEQIKSDADTAIAELKKIDVTGKDDLTKLRHRNLIRLLEALNGRVDFLQGKKLSFDEESQILYDAVSPSQPAENYDKILAQMEELLPGDGPLSERLDAFTKQFIIPPDKVDAVFKAAIAEGRKRTKEHIQLEANESFILEYVKNKPWGAYNWFKGNATSLIQVNTDLPIFIDRAVGLACHEGYPGHHVYYTLIEQKFYKEKGWVEYAVYPLFSPLSLIAEGTANFGVEVAFPTAERIKYEKEVLFPLAGLDPANVEKYYKIKKLGSQLTFAGNDIGRRYLDKTITREEAIQQYSKYRLMTPGRADKYLSFIDQYRSYIINYNVGYKMVKDYIEKRGGTEDNPQKRWDEFKNLLSTPVLPSDLK